MRRETNSLRPEGSVHFGPWDKIRPKAKLTFNKTSTFSVDAFHKTALISEEFTCTWRLRCG